VPDQAPEASLTAPPPFDFTTTDPEEAHAFLRDAYVDNTMRIKGSRDGFRMRNTHHELGAFAFSSLSHTMAVEHVAQPLGYVLIGRVQVGRFECETEARTVRAGAQDVFLVAPPDRPYVARWETMRLQLIRVDLALVGAVAGVDPERLRFTDTEAHSPGAARHLGRTLNYVAETLLTDPVARTDARIVRESGRLLAASVLRAFPNTARREPSG
jgi:AraC-like protein